MLAEIRNQLATIRTQSLLVLPKGWKIIEVKFEVSDTSPLPDYDVTLQNTKNEKNVVTGGSPSEVIKGIRELVQFFK